MSAVASLLSALDAGRGDRLVLQAGERPHVFAGEGRHDVGSAALTETAIAALCAHVLSHESRSTLADTGRVEQVLVAEDARRVRVVAERREGAVRVELVPEPAAPAGQPATPASVSLPVTLDEWVARAALRDATALYLRGGEPPALRVRERVEPLGTDPVQAALVEPFHNGDAGHDGWQQAAPHEWTKAFTGVGQVRCRTFTDQRGRGIVLHLRALAAAVLLQRHIPRAIRHVCDVEDGLVVVSAPTQREMLAMVAAVAEYASARRGGYLVSIEHGMRLEQRISGAFVSQRDAGGSDEEFATAIRAAVSERPDVLVVAPVRTGAAAEVVGACGHNRLVIAGLVANTSWEALATWTGRGRPEEESHARAGLSVFLRGAFNHRSLRRIGGGRVVAQDLLIPDADVRSRLSSGDLDAIVQAEPGDRRGLTLTRSLVRAVLTGQISLRHAAAQGSDVSSLVAAVRAARRDRRHQV